MYKTAQRWHQAPGGFIPGQPLLVTNRDFSRCLPMGVSPVACMFG